MGTCTWLWDSKYALPCVDRVDEKAIKAINSVIIEFIYQASLHKYNMVGSVTTYSYQNLAVEAKGSRADSHFM